MLVTIKIQIMEVSRDANQRFWKLCEIAFLKRQQTSSKIKLKKYKVE